MKYIWKKRRERKVREKKWGGKVTFYVTPPKKLGPPGPTSGTKGRKEKPKDIH